MIARFLTFSILLLTLVGCAHRAPEMIAAPNTGHWHVLAKDQLTLGAHHQQHADIFGSAVEGTYNYKVLEGVDRAQASAMDGGGYFIGIKADPPESPIGYDLVLYGAPLLKAPRTTSYCSGASYTAFIEGMNLIHPDGATRLSPDRYESLRMQEPEGGRREDTVKFWGKWNDDGFGSQYALVQYSGMGIDVEPVDALPGDFMNITWTNGGGHSVVFLGWSIDPETGDRGLMYWASQKGTNGLGDQLVKLERIKVVRIVRLTNPDAVFDFDVNTPVERRIAGHKIEL